MRAFDLNHITIEPTDIPPDVTIDDASRQVRPQDRSGVVVRFPIKFSHGALLTLVDEAGAAVPLGSTAKLRATGAIVPVGYEGAAYLEDLSAHNEIEIEWPNGRRCNVAFNYRELPGDIPTIEPLRCVEPRPRQARCLRRYDYRYDHLLIKGQQRRGGAGSNSALAVALIRQFPLSGYCPMPLRSVYYLHGSEPGIHVHLRS
jgi:hypothetical protein